MASLLHAILNISFLFILYNSSHDLLDPKSDGCDYPMHSGGGYINYLRLFYCHFASHPLLGYVSLFLWLLVLFYLLGNTAANYFCPNLQSLARTLNLRPALAGVTLLSLGNGAPDVFSSVVSFLGPDSARLVGINSILGGALFVTTVVAGVVSICVGPKKVYIDKLCFLRDVCFLISVVMVLGAMLVIGKINLWAAVGFVSLYLGYVIMVSVTHMYGADEDVTDVDLGAALLMSESKEKKVSKHWNCRKVMCLLEFPLDLPRRMSIPMIGEKWSKPFAVVSVTLAPLLLATVWNEEEELVYYVFGGLIGFVFGVIVVLKTERECPPTTFVFLWLSGGFLMSVIWTYILAKELVSLLVSSGHILNISPSVLGLTVLAWGNSLGDLIANVAVASHGGPSGAQVAISGCYGGPIFNMLIGLGLSLVVSSWGTYPKNVDIPEDPTVLLTVGFLIAGLFWSFVMLPSRGMRPDRVLGIGLVAIYFCFLSVRLGHSFGWIKL